MTTDRDDAGTRAAGMWLAVGALLMIIGILTHGAVPEATAERMDHLNDEAGMWQVSHGVLSVAGGLWIMGALLLLTRSSGPAGSVWGSSGWAMVAAFQIPVAIATLVEGTVVVDLAATGNVAAFEAWDAFGQGAAAALPLLFLGLTLAAVEEVSATSPVGSRWAAWGGLAGSLIATFTLALWMWFGTATGPAWVVGAVLAGLWVLWLGISLLRPDEHAEISDHVRTA